MPLGLLPHGAEVATPCRAPPNLIALSPHPHRDTFQTHAHGLTPPRRSARALIALSLHPHRDTIQIHANRPTPPCPWARAPMPTRPQPHHVPPSLPLQHRHSICSSNHAPCQPSCRTFVIPMPPSPNAPVAHPHPLPQHCTQEKNEDATPKQLAVFQARYSNDPRRRQTRPLVSIPQRRRLGFYNSNDLLGFGRNPLGGMPSSPRQP